LVYPSQSKEKSREYRKRHYAKKLAEDPEYSKKRSANWRKAHPEYLVNYRTTHREFLAQRMREWYAKNKKHRINFVNKWMQDHPEIQEEKLQYMKLLYHGKIALAEFCETCPEDDVRKATGNHHPDPAYPQIVVSCCDACHHYLNLSRVKANEPNSIRNQIGANESIKEENKK
jgi:hypothetical protein